MKLISNHIIFFFLLLIIELKTNNNNNSETPNINEKDKLEQIIELDDSNFDLIIQKGSNNRWLILFYLETCYHCQRARTVLNRILELREYKKINNIKFASIEVEKNPKCNDRFYSSRVPYIILVENNTMIEFDLYASESNLINFIETNFTNNSDTKPFPKYSIFKFYYRTFNTSLYYVSEEINNYLESKNIKFKFTPLTLLGSYIVFCFILWTIVILIVLKCFGIKKKKMKKNRIISDENNKNNKASNEEDNNHEENKEIKNNNEESKKLIEENKIEEETENKIKEIDNNQDIKNEKKKKD